jgi:four helix bundle protein
MKNEKITKFEQLNVFKQARCLTNNIYKISGDGCFNKDYGLKDQIRRSAVSVMSNVAEGFERGSNTEFVQFLYIAKGSCGEVKAQLMIAFDQGYITDSIYKSIIHECENISGMLNNFIRYLQTAKFAGMKYKNKVPSSGFKVSS